MGSTLIGVILGVIGLLLSAWSIWYAWSQSKLLQDIKRNEKISLWAHLDRIRTLFSHVQQITRDEDFITNGNLKAEHVSILPKLDKGLADEYVRIVELIVKKSQNLSIETIEYWMKIGKIKSEWQKGQFINLLEIDEPNNNEPNN